MATHSGARPVNLNLKNEEVVSLSRSRRTVNRFLRHRIAVIGVIIMVAIILFVILGALVFSEADANYNDTSRRLQGPSTEFPFGTDTIGRNILARIIYGGQISMLIGVTAVTVAVILGTTVGVASGYFGGLVDSILMRLTEAMLSIPSLLLLLVMAKFFSGKIPTQQFLGRSFSGSVIVIVLILGLTSWMTLARIVRSAVLSIRETEYIMAAEALGATKRRIILAHILPNTLAPIIVAATLGVASAILSEAYISFLGVGVQPPTATWGNMLDGSRQFIEDAPWLWFFPGLMIVLTVLSINFIGDGLRDAFDPRSDKKV
ncbi:MAG TPA: ABC transporter permease [Phototrophicaceae bacterium]|nr:ABC transporter permease [Phototrophicaceae bacterium]